MLMFRFWASDSRGSDATVQIDQPMFDLGKPVAQHPLISVSSVTAAAAPRPPKRQRPTNPAIASQTAAATPAVKRPIIDGDGGSPRKKVALAAVEEGELLSHPVTAQVSIPVPVSEAAKMERAKEVIEHEFSHAILLKHQELRLINQEMAKCQVALEQLRRCHLIPYPVNVPTPEQMLTVTNGQGPALQAKMGAKVPQWAAPFGVTDGPYVRHYAKWLIPDPKFDGVLPEMSTYADAVRYRNSAEGRATRNNIAEVGGILGKGRPGRGVGSQKLQSLSSGYPQPKDKAGPCILKRADGKTVKLVCLVCHRENFSSTQGFINHCRIAHKKDYKSHEEAAVVCGHPIEVDQGGSIVGEEKPVASGSSSTTTTVTTSTTPPSGLVHPFARENALAESEACFSVVTRINESLDLYRKGQLHGVTSIPGVSAASAPVKTKPQQSSTFTPCMESPNLSRLLQSRGKSLNLGELVRDAKTKVDLDDVSSPEEESEDTDVGPAQSGFVPVESLVPRMRVPARTTMSPVPVPVPVLPISALSASSKGRTPPMPFAAPITTPTPRLPNHDSDLHIDDEMDIDLSPNTAVSYNAPSLVSDDGEYDDSVDGSCDESEVNDSLDAESVSDVAEITFDDDHVGPRSLRHHRGSSGAEAEAVRIRKEDSKHVTFVSPVKETGNHKRSR